MLDVESIQPLPRLEDFPSHDINVGRHALGAAPGLIWGREGRREERRLGKKHFFMTAVGQNEGEEARRRRKKTEGIVGRRMEGREGGKEGLPDGA